MRVLAIALLAGVACGGTSSSGPGDTTRLRLVSTVPVPNGTMDRTAPLSFTFSVPVTWKELQFATCNGACRSPMVPYQFTSTGTQVVGTPILPPEMGQSYAVRVSPLVGSPQADTSVDTSINFTFKTLPPVNVIAADVTTDTTLIAGVTYLFDPTTAPKIRSKLTILPGADVSGDLVTVDAGSIEAIGLPGAHIRISNGTISGVARLSYVDAANVASFTVTGGVDHSTIYGGRFLGVSMTIDGSLTDSRVSGMLIKSLLGPVERNVFLGSTLPFGGDLAAPWTAKTQFLNNFVVAYGSYSGLSPTYTYQVSGGSIRGNSFTGFVSGYFRPLEGSSTADLSGNWWDTTDMTAIGTYFAPFNDDGKLRSAPPVVTPILTAADPLTPTG